MINNYFNVNKLYLSAYRPKLIWIVFLLITGSSGCFNDTHRHEPVQDLSPELPANAKSFLTQLGAYSATAELPINSLRDQWSLDGQVMDVALVAPNSSGNWPLILYLPGLGESVEAGRWWREYWAKQGYAVLSLQPISVATALQQLPKPEQSVKEGEKEEDQDCRTMKKKQSSYFDWQNGDSCQPTTLAVDSELRYLGNQYFNVAATQQRIGQIRAAFAHLKQLIAGGDARFIGVDSAHVTVAGYDLGAFTASAIIGEAMPGLHMPDLGFKPQAAILISPSVDIASGNPKLRFRQVGLPMLVVTGVLDDDPFAITTAQARTAPWTYATGKSQYLLVLTQADHAVLAGGEFNLRVRHQPGEAGGLFAKGRKGHGDSKSGSDDKSAKGEQRDAHAIADVQSVTTAFLDSAVKQRAEAASWLGADAALWLGRSASLSGR
jgi:hypothetical protein